MECLLGMRKYWNRIILKVMSISTPSSKYHIVDRGFLQHQSESRFILCTCFVYTRVQNQNNEDNYLSQITTIPLCTFFAVCC